MEHKPVNTDDWSGKVKSDKAPLNTDVWSGVNGKNLYNNKGGITFDKQKLYEYAHSQWNKQLIIRSFVIVGLVFIVMKIPN